MELALLIPPSQSADPADSLKLPPALLRLMEGVERSLTSDNSRRAYRTSLLQFFAWCGTINPASFSRMTVLQYKDALIGKVRYMPDGPQRRLSTSTVNLRLAAVRTLAQEAADQGLLNQAEAAAIRRVRGERVAGTRMGMWIAKDELDRILLTPDRATIRGKRDYALLAVLFSTGIRRRELVELSVATLQQRDGQWGLIDLRG